jgi:hypothetical protein
MTKPHRLELRLDAQTRDAIERLRGDLSASEYLRRLVLADEVRKERADPVADPPGPQIAPSGGR